MLNFDIDICTYDIDSFSLQILDHIYQLYLSLQIVKQMLNEDFDRLGQPK